MGNFVLAGLYENLHQRKLPAIRYPGVCTYMYTEVLANIVQFVGQYISDFKVGLITVALISGCGSLKSLWVEFLCTGRSLIHKNITP